MYLSEFISKHLDYNYPLLACETSCKMCGKFIKQGIKQSYIIKASTFADYQYLHCPNSKFVCSECSALIGQITINDKQTWLRNFSFIVTKDNLTILKRENILKYVLNPPVIDFVFCVTYSNKKHIAFKSAIQCESRHYFIYTDKGEVSIDLNIVESILPILQSWYTILPDKQDTQQQPTWFSKTEILNGGHNFKNIKAYGLDKYQKENHILEQYRNTSLLKLLTFILNKQTYEWQ